MAVQAYSNFTLPQSFFLFMSSTNWLMSSHTGEHVFLFFLFFFLNFILLYFGAGMCFSLLSLQIQCLSLSETSLQTYPELFHRLSGHPLAQSRWHIKLITTMIQMPTVGISLAFKNCVPGRGNNILKDSEAKGKQHLQVTEVLK